MTPSWVIFELSADWFERNDLQSEHKSSTKSFELIEAEVSHLEASPETPRRRWSAAAKERIVAEAARPRANVSAIARSNGLSPQQVFAWRRKAAISSGQKNMGSAVPSFATVALDGVEAGGVVELVVAGVTLRIGPTVRAARVKELLRAVRSA
jgi:transposase